MATDRIDVKNLPAFAELFRATHVLLVKRLRGELDTPDGLRAWNDLIAAHDAIAEVSDGEVVHQCPGEGEATMPCCGKTPFEVPKWHRMTVDEELVTCGR